MSGIARRPLAVITISSGLGEGPKAEAITPSEEKDVSGLIVFPIPGTTLLVTVVAVTLSSTIIPRPLWRRLDAGDGGRNAGSILKLSMFATYLCIQQPLEMVYLIMLIWVKLCAYE